jgi:hypothetical protein
LAREWLGSDRGVRLRIADPEKVVESTSDGSNPPFAHLTGHSMLFVVKNAKKRKAGTTKKKKACSQGLVLARPSTFRAAGISGGERSSPPLRCW